MEDKQIQQNKLLEETRAQKDGEKNNISQKGQVEEAQRKVFHLEHANLKMRQDVQAMSTRMVKEK